MSLPWIKVFPRVRTHLKTDRLGDLLGRRSGVHHLVIDLWLWASEECPTGDVSAVPPVILARKAGWRGDPDRFVEALRTAGFLDADGMLHDWDEHQPAHIEAASAATTPAGESKAERRRRLDRERKSKRNGSGTKRNDAENSARVPHDEAERSGTDAETVRKNLDSDGPNARAKIEIQIQTEKPEKQKLVGPTPDVPVPAAADDAPPDEQPALPATDTTPPKAKSKRAPATSGVGGDATTWLAEYRAETGATEANAPDTKAFRVRYAEARKTGNRDAETLRRARKACLGGTWWGAKDAMSLLSEKAIQSALAPPRAPAAGTTGPPLAPSQWHPSLEPAKPGPKPLTDAEREATRKAREAIRPSFARTLPAEEATP